MWYNEFGLLRWEKNQNVNCQWPEQGRTLMVYIFSRMYQSNCCEWQHSTAFEQSAKLQDGPTRVTTNIVLENVRCVRLELRRKMDKRTAFLKQLLGKHRQSPDWFWSMFILNMVEENDRSSWFLFASESVSVLRAWRFLKCSTNLKGQDAVYSQNFVFNFSLL